jgi:hypothetical protein
MNRAGSRLMQVRGGRSAGVDVAAATGSTAAPPVFAEQAASPATRQVVKMSVPRICDLGIRRLHSPFRVRNCEPCRHLVTALFNARRTPYWRAAGWLCGYWQTCLAWGEYPYCPDLLQARPGNLKFVIEQQFPASSHRVVTLR